MKIIKYAILIQVPDDIEGLVEKTLELETSYSESKLERVKNEEGLIGYEIVGEDDPIIPTEEEDTSAMLIDLEYRLTLLELGITED